MNCVQGYACHKLQLRMHEVYIYIFFTLGERPIQYTGPVIWNSLSAYANHSSRAMPIINYSYECMKYIFWTLGERPFQYIGPVMWSSLSLSVRQFSSLFLINF